jgi:integrase
MGVMSFFDDDLAALAVSSKQSIMFFVAKFLHRFEYITKDDYTVLTNLYKPEYKMWSEIDITQDDVAEMIRYFDYNNKPDIAAFTFLSATIGSRLGQTINLTKDDIHILPDKIEVVLSKQKQNMLNTPTVKSVKSFKRSFAINDYTTETFFIPYLEMIKITNEKYIFERNNNHVQDRYVQMQFESVSKRINKKVTPHSLRHYVGNKIAQQFGLLKASALLDHNNIKVTQKYINPKSIDTSNFLE